MNTANRATHKIPQRQLCPKYKIRHGRRSIHTGKPATRCRNKKARCHKGMRYRDFTSMQTTAPKQTPTMVLQAYLQLIDSELKTELRPADVVTPQAEKKFCASRPSCQQRATIRSSSRMTLHSQRLPMPKNHGTTN